jgi:competence protein ComEA
VGERIRGLLTTQMARAVVGACMVALIVLAMTLIWQGRRQPTVIVSVQHVDDPGLVRVYVGGSVNRPGVVTLPRGSRVADAIAAAGGITETADTSSLGMAAMLEDSDQIMVATLQAEAPQAPTTTTTPMPASIQPVASVPTRPTSAPDNGIVQGSILVNINTATLAELDTLPGIGPAIAQRIIDYRTVEGPFQAVEELESVSGISARMVTELQTLITVGT